MKIVLPEAEWWPQQSLSQHIAHVGRICYKSQGKQPPAYMDNDEDRRLWEHNRDQKLCKSFWDSGHRSMFRHATAYFFVANERTMPGKLWALLEASPYIDYSVKGSRVWMSSNMQFLMENENLRQLLQEYAVEESEFIRLARKYKSDEALYLLRMTIVVTTQISTSRELNRTSPNAIAEQSTRYCNLEKKGGVRIALPLWYHDGSWWQKWVYRLACRTGEWAYNRLLKSGLKAQDARGVLPLDTYTVAAYTYSIAEWKHIIDLRYHGTTGKPHPNARRIMGEVRAVITARMQEYIPDFNI